MPLGMVLILAFFTLILGYVIGNFLPMLKENPFSPKADSPSSSLDRDNPQPADPRPDHASSQDRPTSIPGMLEIARMFRQEGTNQLAAQIDNKLISGKDELTSDQHALLSLLLLDLTDWIGIQSRLDYAAGLTDPALSAMEDKDEKSPQKPGFSPVDMFKKALQADVFLPSADTSLADQIDPILQDLLESTSLADRGIRLMDIKGRGTTVVVGLDFYDSMEDVPDPEIQAIIRKAVSIWESRQGGKK